MIDQNAINRILSPILQKGFRVRLKAAMTIRQLLEDECNLSSAFVEREISTVFLNGKAVDNIDKAMVTDKCELALSGPMPGFVGAAMRRGGYYSSMRSAISYTEEGFAPGSGGGTVTVKLYNTLIN
ncbi:MAG: hypothetical protein ACP5VS_10850, partial [Desulfomonilaceae bacterium]